MNATIPTPSAAKPVLPENISGGVRMFEGIGAAAYPNGTIRYLKVDPVTGTLEVPAGMNPQSWKLSVFLPKDNPQYLLVQKNVAETAGAYHDVGVPGRPAGDFERYLMRFAINVRRAGRNVWTVWHDAAPNRVDIWHLGLDGGLDLIQAGVITHDDGKTWKLLTEYRWRGKLFRQGEGLVAAPKEGYWGSFSSRVEIFKNPDFQKLVSNAQLAEWKGLPEDLNPVLESNLADNEAVVQWYVAFGGQTGQGIAIRRDGKTAWVHGADVQIKPNADGIKRLWTGDVIKFTDAVDFGSQAGTGRPPKLMNVTKVVS